MPSRVRPVFQRLRVRLRAAFPDFDATIAKGKASEFPTLRAHAYCVDTTPPTIVYAPKLERARLARIEGVIRHELGHALAFHAGVPGHAERDADDLARRTLGATIRYDADEVQTTGAGVTPRPAHLG
jgi:hypothetical protein